MNEIMPFAATLMDLEIIILNEVRERQISYVITYMWNTKKWYKWTYLQNRTDSEISKTYVYQRGEVGGGIN